MRVSYLSLIYALLGTCLSQSTDLVTILESIPACAAECSLKVLTPANCSVADIRSCFCTSFELQYDVGLCVLGSCNVTDQYIATVIAQDELCAGVWQPSRSAETVRASIIIATFAFTIVALRFISRVVIARKIWWDDWAILVAAVFMVPNTAIPIYLSYHGFGKHFFDVPPQNVILLGQLFYTSQIFYVFIQNIPKFSILLLYLRIFPGPRFVLITKIVIAWMVCHTLGFLFAVVFQCTPVAHFWDATVEGKCVNEHALAFTGAGLSIAADLVIMFLPVYELKGLNLTLRKRVALVGMFALGSFACITSMIRLKYLVLYGSSIDTTWNNVDVVIWSELETYTAVICACLMTIRPLFYRFFPSLFPATVVGGGNNSRSNTNPSWGLKISKIRQSRSGHEILGDEEVDRRSRLRKGRDGKIVVVTESSVSHEMESQVGSRMGRDGDLRTPQRSYGHGEDFLEDASLESR